MNYMLKYTKNVNNIIGENKMRVEILLKEKRKEKKFTLSQLSAKTGISTTHINDIENNIKEPSISMLVRIAKALDVKVEDLYKVQW